MDDEMHKGEVKEENGGMNSGMPPVQNPAWGAPAAPVEGEEGEEVKKDDEEEAGE